MFQTLLQFPSNSKSPRIEIKGMSLLKTNLVQGVKEIKNTHLEIISF